MSSAVYSRNPADYVHGIGYKPEIVKEFRRIEIANRYYLEKHKNEVRTIQDLERLYSAQLTDPNTIQKADAPLTTSTTGAYNPIYGTFAWNQLNLEANLFAILPKVPWKNSGWKMTTARGTTADQDGAGEGVTPLPETVKQTFQDVATKPKTVMNGFSVTALEQRLGQGGANDMFANPLMELQEHARLEHNKIMNENLLREMGSATSNRLLSIDKIVSSNGEVGIAGYSGGEADIYGMDRDAGASVIDSQVLHNSGTDRDITPKLINTLITNVMKYSDPSDPLVFVTGYDTAQTISELRASQGIWEKAQIQPSVNGVKTLFAGQDGGFEVPAWNNIPIIRSNDVPVDGSSRLYLLNLKYLFLGVLMNTQYYQTGVNTRNDPYALDFMGDEGIYVTQAETVCVFPRAQGKLRDLA